MVHVRNLRPLVCLRIEHLCRVESARSWATSTAAKCVEFVLMDGCAHVAPVFGHAGLLSPLLALQIELEEGVEVTTREHARNLFSIAVDSARGRVYTVAQDRSVVATSLTGTRLYSLPCFAGFVYAVASNPIEPSTLAIGAGDGLIR